MSLLHTSMLSGLPSAIIAPLEMAPLQLALLEGFVNPALALGVGLASVPLIIHLLNRQRHRPLEWAAMRFVEAAWKRTRRRARLESLLLLLLRMAVVALLALAVARPFADAGSALGALTESRRDVVLVLDGSASMGLREGSESLFEMALGRARERVLELDVERGDRVRLVLAAGAPRLISWRSPEDAFSMLGTLAEPTDEDFDFTALLGELVVYAKEDVEVHGSSTLELLLYTDMQRSVFESASGQRPAAAGTAGNAGEIVAGREAATEPPSDAPRSDELLDQLASLGATLRVVGIGSGNPRPPNVGVEAIELEAGVLGAGSAVQVDVRLRNFGAEPITGLRVALELDGERRPTRLVDLPAVTDGGGAARANFEVAFPAAGDHVLSASVASDALQVDDRRTRVVHVPEPVRVLLVNGEPHFDIESDETGLLGAVLAPPGDGGGLEFSGMAAPFEARVVEPGELRSAALLLTEFDLIVLANVAYLDEASTEKLRERVAAGAGLLICAGDNLAANIDNWNRGLFQADGSGLLPAELGSRIAVSDRRTDWWRVATFREDHPVLQFFADERWKPLLTEVPIFEFQSCRPLPDARVLARLDDEEGSPLLVERSFDRGKVLLWTTSIDPEWARVAESPLTMVPLVHELARYAPAQQGSDVERTVGESFQAEIEGFPRSPVVLRPGGARRPLTGEPESISPGLWRLPPFTETDRAGLYRIEFDGLPALPFAVGLSALEGDLERITAAAIDGLHPALASLDKGALQDGPDEGPAASGELWRSLALGCLLALIAESLWAGWIGHRRSRP